MESLFSEYGNDQGQLADRLLASDFVSAVEEEEEGGGGEEEQDVDGGGGKKSNKKRKTSFILPQVCLYLLLAPFSSFLDTCTSLYMLLCPLLCLFLLQGAVSSEDRAWTKHRIEVVQRLTSLGALPNHAMASLQQVRRRSSRRKPKDLGGVQ